MKSMNLSTPKNTKPASELCETASPPGIYPWRVCLALILLGAVATVGWSPLEQVWVTWLAFAALAVSITGASGPFQALVRCFSFALGLHTIGHGWVFSALLHQTDAGLLWSLAGSALFLTYLTLFLAIPALFCKWLSERLLARETKAKKLDGAFLLRPMTLAVAWAGCEAMRGLFFNGFDSLAAGYLFSAEPLRGWVPVLGVYGCSLLFYASTTIAGEAWNTRRGSIRWSAAIAGVPLVLVLAGGTVLDSKQWVQAAGAPLSFRLIQGGIAQKVKFDLRERERQITTYVDAITAEPADLIVTPETAFPIDLTELSPAVLPTIRAFSSATRSNIFLGMPYSDVHGGERNSMFQVAPGRSELPRYDKTRLMPFGEYAPIGFGWFTQRMSVALNNQTPGLANQPPFEAMVQGAIVNIGVLICHEDLSYADARHWAGKASLFINPGNLAWFEGTLALPQRMQIARIRALETGRPLLRTTNTGVTAHIDSKGKVVSQLSLDNAAVLAGSVQPTSGLTPFAIFGNLLAIGLASTLLLSAALIRAPSALR